LGEARDGITQHKAYLYDLNNQVDTRIRQTNSALMQLAHSKANGKISESKNGLKNAASAIDQNEDYAG